MSTNCKNTLNNMSSFISNFQLKQIINFETCSAFNDKFVIVDLYEVSDFDKTFLLNQLKQKFEQTRFLFYENFQMIVIVVFDDFDAFQKMKKQKKVQ